MAKINLLVCNYSHEIDDGAHAVLNGVISRDFSHAFENL